jgi:hypothetical protein
VKRLNLTMRIVAFGVASVVLYGSVAKALAYCWFDSCWFSTAIYDYSTDVTYWFSDYQASTGWTSKDGIERFSGVPDNANGLVYYWLEYDLPPATCDETPYGSPFVDMTEWSGNYFSGASDGHSDGYMTLYTGCG